MNEIKSHSEIKDIKQEEKGFLDIKPKISHTKDELNNIVKKEFNNITDQSKTKISESLVPEKYKLNKAIESKGEWSGEKGNSLFYPESTEVRGVLKGYGVDGIKYKNGEPDFSNVSEATVTIDNMTSNRINNFKHADYKCAEKWSKEGKEGKTDWTRTDVREWRHTNRYSWHERSDTKTMDLVQRDIHFECKHFGGVAECKRREKILGGGFDE